MAKKIIYIVIGSVLVFGLLFLLWSWFFSPSATSQQNGSFGTSTDRTQTLGNAGTNTNGQTTLGSNGQVVNGTVNLGGGGTGNTGTNGGGVVNSTASGGTVTFDTGTVSVGGVDWLGGSGSGGVGGSSFTASGINTVNTGGNGSLPTFIPATTLGGSSGGLSLLDALVAAGITGAAVCGARAALTTAKGVTGASTAAATTQPFVATPGAPVVADIGTRQILAFIAGNQGAQTGLKTADETTDFESCLVRVAAKAALNVMTKSIVNWINSGFNGKPSFVQNYTQFFTNVADQAAGEFIQGSGLAFLCSPFKLQIKIAIAQAYANRSAQSCSITKVISNLNGFMNGNFSQGGWPGFVSFTTMPINNPYGSYAYAQIGLSNSINTAQSQKANELLRGNGFLDVTKQQNCKPTTTDGITSYACDPPQIVTPGTVVASSLNTTLGTSFRQEELAKSFDEIANALVTQLITKTLQNGLTSLSASGGIGSTLSAGQQQALSQAQQLLNNMQASITLAQEYGTIEQGSISDIQQAQNNLSSLANCWSIVASSSNPTSDAAAKTAAAQQQIQALEGRVTLYNNEITRANASIAAVQSLQTELAAATTPADVTAASNNFSTLAASGSIISQTDVTTAAQNRTTLQTEMASLNQSTQDSFAQCKAAAQ